MFSQKNKNTDMVKNNQDADNNSINIIGAGTEISGDISSNGDVRIDGKLKGNVTLNGKLVIGPTGHIIGEIKCKNSDVSGKIEGKIIVSELLSLKSTSKINGEIITNKLSIEPGSIFSGSCNMDGNASTGSRVAPTQPKK